MPEKRMQLEEFLQFIKERRSDESHFEEIYHKLEEVLQSAGDDQQAGTNFFDNLEDVKEKQAEEYRKAKEVGGTAWPEYEKFITQLERNITEALR
jgi:hypothetical protein